MVEALEPTLETKTISIFDTITDKGIPADTKISSKHAPHKHGLAYSSHDTHCYQHYQ